MRRITMVRLTIALIVMALLGATAAAVAAVPIDEGTTALPAAQTTATQVEDVCVGAYPHPVANRLAAQYEVAYEEIMGWFCEGHYGLGEIKLALATGRQTDLAPEEVLAMKTELGGWGQVWLELGLKGKKDKDPEGAEPPGAAKRGNPWKVPPGLVGKDKVKPDKGKP